ncbi:MAG: RluA family pseudouridine synthase [Bryocella sp.]
MPSKNMLPKGKRRESVKKDYRAARTLANDHAEAAKARADANFGEQTAEESVELIDTADMMEHEPTLEERIENNNWITTKGASGSKVAQETHEPPRYANRYKALLTEAKPAAPEIQVVEDLEPEDGVRTFTAEAAAQGMRLDAYLAKALPDISRGRVVVLIEGGQVTVDGAAAKGKQKLKGGEVIEIEGEPRPEPLHAEPEDIPLEIVYEDKDLAVVNKPAGMMVHAGAGSTEQNRGTLVNALLFHMGKDLSQVSGDLRPGIVHRLDKQTSGLIVVAKNDSAHRKLGEMFATRSLRKIYLALVHGLIAEDEGTINLAIARDVLRRTRMTTKRAGGRHAISNWRVLERIEGAYGKFTLVEVHIETGRTHQIRVHMQAIGHPVLGDTLYGAPEWVKPVRSLEEPFALGRNFLHAAEIEFAHPRTGKILALDASLPDALVEVLERVRKPADAATSAAN